MNSLTEIVEIMRYADGEKLGEAAIGPAERESYARCDHPQFQWPQGIAEAGGVFTEEQLDTMKIGPKTVIYLEF